MALDLILKKISELWKSRDEKDSLEKNRSCGSKNKTSSWDEVAFLKNEFREGSLEDRLKSDILDLMEEVGVENFSQFYDLVFRSNRNNCPYGLFGEEGECYDVIGEGLAYNLESIEKAFNLTRPKCSEICKLGCCARQNILASDIYQELVKTKIEKDSGACS